ncbi:recombinase family protein [Sphingobacterium siyangense]|uniref:recombinase family protein n=2 Tax=Sphingobacterium TaxID=28453 RepID=UPI003DA58640
MKTAYLYVRVSTDEQKKKGYSLPEQEDRLLKYCDYNNIKVLGVYREDYSAKDFNRPEWKKLLATVKQKPREDKNILFIKWDRFSRNIEYAYEMIGLLRKYNTIPIAIDQPIDLSVPESTVMLAVYLSVPEAENSRRAMNTANGIRRAKQMGRFPGKAPLGYINMSGFDGRKIIVPKQPEANIIKWVFRQLAKNTNKIDYIRKIADAKGLKCSRSHFFRIIRNPAYCGLISIKISSKEQQMVKGIHDPLISEVLFNEVQRIITRKRIVTSKTNELNETFYLKSFLLCPICYKRLCGSFSKGKTKRYPYYHCNAKCKTRVNALTLNDAYCSELQSLQLSKNVAELFSSILEDCNINIKKAEDIQERNMLVRRLRDQELLLSQARKLFVASVLGNDDYYAIKREYQINSQSIKGELSNVNTKLENYKKHRELMSVSFIDVFQVFKHLETADKMHLVSLIPPNRFDLRKRSVSLHLDSALSKILLPKISEKQQP